MKVVENFAFESVFVIQVMWIKGIEMKFKRETFNLFCNLRKLTTSILKGAIGNFWQIRTFSKMQMK